LFRFSTWKNTQQAENRCCSVKRALLKSTKFFSCRNVFCRLQQWRANESTFQQEWFGGFLKNK
jgi:hypothetical protein